jgi:hypothetical protein
VESLRDQNRFLTERPEVSARIARIDAEAVENQVCFRNALLYGKPGDRFDFAVMTIVAGNKKLFHFAPPVQQNGGRDSLAGDVAQTFVLADGGPEDDCKILRRNIVDVSVDFIFKIEC